MPPPRLVTVDVFDTILTRVVGHPSALFRPVGRRLASAGLTQLDPERFALCRASAEAEIRPGAPGNEVTIQEIYFELHRRGLVTGDPMTSVRIELETEERALLPVPGAEGLLQQLRREESPNLVFLSDTYFIGSWIKDQLERFDLWRDGDSVRASSETRQSKLRGDAYSELSVGLGTPLHLGDNHLSDVLRAREAGFEARQITGTALNRFERWLEGQHASSDGVASVMAGASRLTRLSQPATGSHQRAIRDVAASVAGPAMAAYVLWLLERARTDRLDRLYFVARDGETLAAFARHLAPLVGPEDLDIRYVYGSRQAWMLPSITRIDDAARAWLFGDSDGLSIQLLAERAGIPATRVRASAPSNPEMPHDDVPLGPDELRALSASPELARLVLESADERRALAIAYLAQEDLLDRSRIGVVDIGWKGRVGGALRKLLDIADSHASTHFYYFALGREATSFAPPHSECFVADHRTGVGSGIAYASLLEAMCAASHGPTAGYRAVTGGTVEPILQPVPPDLQTWGVAQLQGDLRSFVGALADGLRAVPEIRVSAAGSLATIADGVMRELTERPTRQEAEAWGSFPHDPGPGGARTRPLAPPEPWIDVIIPRSSKRPPRDPLPWRAASRARTPTLVLRAAGLRRRAMGLQRSLRTRWPRATRLRRKAL